MTTKNFLKTVMVAALMLLMHFTTNAQSVFLSFPGGIDNCMAPTPNAGTYTANGSANGRSIYTNGSNLRIIWTGSQWEIQGDDPNISGVTWVTGYVNTNNTSIPPADCWTSPFGCFIPVLSGSAYPALPTPTISLPNTNPTNASTINFTVTFTGTINSLSAANFSLTTSGVSGASISGVSQTSSSVWNVAVNTGSGDGSIALNMNNTSGASAIICSLPASSSAYTIVKTPPTLTSSPSNATACATGGSASFTVGASGTIADYTWQVSTNGGSSWSTVTDGGVYSGATTATLAISNTNGMNNYQFKAEANNVAGSSAFSTAATLTLSSSQNWYYDADGDGFGNSSVVSSSSLINETFSSVLPTNWAQTNNSTTVGTNWFQGAGSNGNITFSAHSGTTNEFIGADYQSLSGSTGTVDIWLFTPTVSLQNGNTFTFWTRTQDNSTYPDRMEVRRSTNGGSTNVGDFSTLELSINPSLVTGNSGYPMTWTQYTITVSGVSGTVTGRFAFRYYVTNSGSSGANGYGIGIDDVSYGFLGSPYASCAAPTGYVANNSDCNDANASITTGSTWYLDADNDGYYVSSTTACSSPGAGYNQTATISGDCDDNNGSVHTTSIFYVDNDGDGYGTGSGVALCALTPPAGYSLNNLDCNDAIFSPFPPKKDTTIITHYMCMTDSFTFFGSHLKQKGTYFHQLTNRFGCDSIIRLRLLWYGIYSKTVNQTLCQGDSILFGGVYRKLSGNYSFHYQSQLGCDSFVTLQLRYKHKSINKINRYFCKGDSTFVNGMYYKIKGTYTIHATNYQGCDSLITLKVYYNNTASITSASMCAGQSYNFCGHSYTAAGTYFSAPHSLTNYKGCDSIARLDLMINCRMAGSTSTQTVAYDEVMNTADNFSMNLYPNPNEGTFTLENNCNTCDKMQVEIYNVSGQLVYSQLLENTAGKMTISQNLSAGMYLVRLSNADNNFLQSKSFVVK